jgi:hypothetical protein
VLHPGSSTFHVFYEQVKELHVFGATTTLTRLTPRLGFEPSLAFSQKDNATHSARRIDLVEGKFMHWKLIRCV